jgi:hypothetical protein
VLLATIVCSDPDCAEEGDVVVDDLDGVDRHVCECGYGFVVISVSALKEAGELVQLPERRPAPKRRAA